MAVTINKKATILLLRNSQIYNNKDAAIAGLESCLNLVEDGSPLVARYKKNGNEIGAVLGIKNTINNGSLDVSKVVIFYNSEESESDIETAISNAIDSLDMSSAVGGTGKMITSINLTNGIVSATAVDAKASNIAYTSNSNTTVEGALNTLYNKSNITVTESTGSGNTLKSYTIALNGTTLGTISIPTDMVVSSGEIVQGTWSGSTFTPSSSGVGKALKLTIANQTNPIYINVADLVDAYTAGNGINISNSNVVSAKIDASSENFLSVDSGGIKLSGVQNAINSAVSDKLTNIEIPDPSEVEGDTVEITIAGNKTVSIPAVNNATGDETYGLMSPSQKTKLDGIASGAEVNVLSDWNQTTTSADDYIKNKPDISGMIQSALVSPTLSGTPTAPTPDPEINNTQIATTNFVHNLFKEFMSGKYRPIEFERFYTSINNLIIGSRTTANGRRIELGKAKLSDTGFSGYTFVWHQYLNGVGSSFITLNARKYLKRIDGEWELFTSAGETITAITDTDMLFNLDLMFGTYSWALPRTQELFQTLFPEDFYKYSAPRILHTTVNTLISNGVDSNGDEFHDIVKLPIMSITGKLNGAGESVVIFPEGMGHVPPSEDIFDTIYKEDGIWKATKTVGNDTYSTDVTWTAWGQSYYHGYSVGVSEITSTTNSVLAYSDGYLNIASNAMNGTDRKGFFSIKGNTNGNNVIYFSKSDYQAGLPSTITVAYRYNTLKNYILDDEWQTYFNMITWNVSTNGTELALPINNGGSPITAPIKIAISYPVIDYEVKRICVENWGGNYFENEITYAEAAEVTTLDAKFYENTNITRFNELRFFTGVTTLAKGQVSGYSAGQFYGCNKLTTVALSKNTKSLNGAFRNCTILSNIDLSALNGQDNIRIGTFLYKSTSNSSLKSITLPCGTYIGNHYYDFRYNTKLLEIRIGGNGVIEFIETANWNNCFSYCNSLTDIIGTISGIRNSIDFKYCPLSVESALVILNGLEDLDGESATITFREEKQTEYEADNDFNTAVTSVTAKGWTIAYATP